MPIRALLVVMSPILERSVRDALRPETDIEIVAATAEAPQVIPLLVQFRPDVVLLALRLFKGDGTAVLQELMSAHPTPVIALAEPQDLTDSTKGRLQALGVVATLGVPDPRAVAVEKNPVTTELAPLLRRAARVKVVRIVTARAGAPVGAPVVVASAPLGDPGKVIVIGSSTGGPAALRTLLSSLPGTLPAPIVIAQHMPSGFTRDLADFLATQCAMRVVEAAEGMALQPGLIFIAPGRQNITLRPGGVVHLEVADGSLQHIPSVDVLFESAARVFRSGALAIVLTGIGRDGAEGVRAVKAAGGRVVVQDEGTSTVFGMPAEAYATGCADAIVPVAHIGRHIIGFAGQGVAP